jgi:hypothetical protein
MIDTEAFAGLKIAEAAFSLSVPVRVNRLAGGEMIPASLGASLWQGTVTLVQGYHRTAAPNEAAIMRLQRPGVTFLAYDSRFNGPDYDPTGSILGAATPTVHTITGTALRITGLPSGYTIRRGDLIGWTYGTSPVRYAVHRAWTPVSVASAGGLTPLIEVEPLIRPGTPVGAAVSLIRPRIRAQLLSPSYGAGRPLITAGAVLPFIQTLT